MKDSNFYKCNKGRLYESLYINQEDYQRHSNDYMSVIPSENKIKKRKSLVYPIQNYTQQPTVIFYLSDFGSSKNRKHLTRHTSTPEIIKKNKRKKLKRRARSFSAISRKKYNLYGKTYVVSEHRFKPNRHPFNNINLTNFKVYRCQLSPNVAENCDNCCCSCNSDAMFEVMKELYNCYKKRNCKNCNCILCCHLPQEERLGIKKKSKPSIDIKAALQEIAMKGFPLPEGKTPSEKKLIDDIRYQLGLPPEPNTPNMREKYTNATNAGLILPLEGKTPAEKEKILQGLANMGIPLPEGRTPSEKSLISRIKERSGPPLDILTPAEMMQKAKAAGLLTPFQGKPLDQREKILRGLAMQGILLPVGQTPSEKKLINKVRAELGLPPEPKTSAMRDKHTKAANVGLLQPLEGKTPAQKEKILQGLHDMGIPLPVGRTPSEKALIDKIKRKSPEPPLSPEKLNKAKAAGLLTPLEGKTPAKIEKILKGLAMLGIPLPEGKTPSVKKLVDKVRGDLALPPGPKTSSMRSKHFKAADDGILLPLEGKSPKEKERILRSLHGMGIPLPKGRTPSEKALIAKIAGGPRTPYVLAPSEKIRKAKAAGLLTPLKGKTPAQKEDILTGLAKLGIPLPEGKTESEKKLIDKIRGNLGLPPEPKTTAMRDKHAKAADAGLLQPLKGKSPKEKEKILRGLADIGIPLPEGKTTSEKSLIARIEAEPRSPSLLTPSEKMHKAKSAGLFTPLEGKTPPQIEKILRKLAMLGIPLPEGKTASVKKLTDKVRADLALPPEPKSPSMRSKHFKAAAAGTLLPLEGKSPKEKEKILRGLHGMGIPLPKGRTRSEKSLIAKMELEPRTPSITTPSEKMRRAKAAGLLTPLKGKTPSQKEKILAGLANYGIPLPEGKTESEKKLIDKVRANLGLPPEPETAAMRDKHAKAADIGMLQPLEGKSPKEKTNILQGLFDMGIPLPEGRTPSEKALISKIKAKARVPPLLTPSGKMREAKAAGLLTPLEGKSPSQVEKILRRLAMLGIPLPEGKTPSIKNLLDKVRAELALPPEPKTSSMRNKHFKAADNGVLLPLEGKSPKEKEQILRDLHAMGIPLPKGRTASEKALIAKIEAELQAPLLFTPSEKISRARTAGLLTPLEGKPPEQIENMLRELAFLGIPLPEGKTPSVRKLIDKVRADLGLPPEPKTPSIRDKYNKAAATGILLPLEGKSPREKEKILRGLRGMGIPLPKGRTSSEKALIAKIEAEPHAPLRLTPSEKLHKAKAAGLFTPLKGKTPEQIEKILRRLAMLGIPLPEGKTPSIKKLMNKIRGDLALPPEPKTPSMKDKHFKAADDGILFPLEGKSPKEKERILRGLHEIGIPLPKGRTPSEKALIAKIEAEPYAALIMTPSEKMRKAKAAGLLTPLEGKTPKQIEKVLRGIAMLGIPLPEGKTPSIKKLINKIRTDLALPPEPKTPSMMDKHFKAADDGILLPLEGKSSKEKAQILQGLYNMDIPLPEGRTPSEKALIAKIGASPRLPLVTTENLRKAKAAGLLTPLEGKAPQEKKRILTNLAKLGFPLPEGKTPSEKQLINKIKKDHRIPLESSAEKIRKAKAAGYLTPLEGKTPDQKEKILRGRAAAGLPLPKGRTPSVRDLINKIKASTGYVTPTPSERLRKATEAGLLTPLKGKSSPMKEKILRDMLAAGIPMPEDTTPSVKEIIKRLTVPQNTESQKIRAAKAAGLLTPLQGKSPAQKEKVLKGLTKLGIPLPKAKTPSDKNVLDKIRAEMGLPPEPKTSFLREKYNKAQDAGLITPLEGKSPAEKENILRNLLEAGIPLPAGRTPSERSMVKRVKAGLSKARIPYDKMTPTQKEKLLRGLVKSGRSLPDALTPSGKELVKKIRNDMGLPPEPETASMKEKMRKAHAAGLITPLEGKSPHEKENILKRLADAELPLPEGRTPSEKLMIRKIRSKIKKKEAKSREGKLLAEKLKTAKDLGLLTPLTGKSLGEKERILKGLAAQGLPLPESTTPSEKQLDAKVRKEMGIPPEPKTRSMKERHNKAAAAGMLMPLEGLTPGDKEKVLRALANRGIPLPEGRTSSEKSLINKINAETTLLKIPPDKLRKAKDAGLLTPLKGKSPAQKEKIIKGLAEAGLPLPVGQTQSEKSLIGKVKAALGIPPPATTPSKKEVIRKAKAKGLFTPLAGKTSAQKEKIIRGLAEAGLPLPEGKTPTEKDIIGRVKAGLPPEFKEHVGSGEQFEGIQTTCDRGCGCDKKKIRFKHSYVTIKVTSPDMSSLCPCPDECIPRPKGGVFVDNDGLRVVVERATGVPQYLKQSCNTIQEHFKLFMPDVELYNTLNNGSTNLLEIQFENNCKRNNLLKMMYEDFNLQPDDDPSSDILHGILDIPLIHTSVADKSRKNRNQYDTSLKNSLCDNLTTDEEEIGNSELSEEHKAFELIQHESNDNNVLTSLHGSSNSILIIKSETSLSFNSSYGNISTKSNTAISDITPYLLSSSYVAFSNSTIEESELVIHGVDYCAVDTEQSKSDLHNNKKAPQNENTNGNILINKNKIRDDVVQLFQMPQIKLSNIDTREHKNKFITQATEPIVVINQLSSEIDITTVVDELLSTKEFSDASSLFVVVPTYDDEEISSPSLSSTTCNQLSKNSNKWKNIEKDEPNLPYGNASFTKRGLKVSARGKKFFLEGVPEVATNNRGTMFSQEQPKPKGVTKNKLCQMTTPNKIILRRHVVSTDTTQDRPCCCIRKDSGYTDSVQSYKDQCVANIVSELITPLLIKQGFSWDPYTISRSISKEPKTYIQAVQTPTSISTCQIPPCAGQSNCHRPEDVLQYPYGTPLPEPLMELKKLLEQPKCDPDKLRQLFERIQASKTPTKSVGCNRPVDLPIISLTPKDEKCPTCYQPKYINGKEMKCACSGKKKTVKIKPLCPCEQHRPPPAKTEKGPKVKTRSLGCQCCLCDSSKLKDPHGQVIPKLGQTAPSYFGTPDGPVSIGVQDGQGCIICPSGLPCSSEKTTCPKPKDGQTVPMGFYGQPNLQRELGQIEIIGPLGGIVLVGPGGTYTQAGITQTRYSTSAGSAGDEFNNVAAESTKKKKKNCACSEKRGKKKRKVICECPPQPEPEPEPEPLIEYTYEDYENFEWLQKKKMNQMRSDLTQTTSGFKLDKKKKPPPEPEVECTIEDAVRYYALKNPKLLRDLVPSVIIEKSGESDCTCEEDKNVSTDNYPPVLSDITATTVDVEPDSSQDEEGPFRGLKLSIGGKGSGSKGLSGICCFDLIQEW